VSIGPVVTYGTIAGILVAIWNMLVLNGLLNGLQEGAARDSVTVVVNLIIPVVAALIARQFVTPVADPNLPIGTVVNRNDPNQPTAKVVDIPPPG
jgi:hypothetical protein